jgi:SSS family solute:Na+ symporter
MASSVSIVLMIVFFGFMVYLGWYSKKWIASSSDYLLAGREISFIINLLGISSIGWAGTSIALAPGLAIRGGLTATIIFAATYALAGVLVYGLLFTTYIRRSGAYTLPEWLEIRYSKRVRTMIALSTTIALVGVTANNILAMALVIQGYTQWPIILAISIGLFTFLIFTYLGGLWAVTLTDFVQMIIGLVGIPLLIFGLISTYGGVGWAFSQWPGEKSLWAAGISGWQLPVWSLQYPSVLTMTLLFSMLLVWGSQHYWIRVASVRSEKVARNSYIGAGILLFLINAILGIVGLYAVAKYPTLFQPVGKLLPEAAYGTVLKDLPVFIGGYLLLFGIAASMSTSSTTLMAASSTAVRDLYQRTFKPQATQKELVKPGRYITIGIGLLTWILCWFPGGPLFLFAFGVAWLGPASILLILGMIWKRTTADGAFWGGLIGLVVMTLWIGLEVLKIYKTSSIAHVGIIGILATALPTLLISLFTKPKYYAKPDYYQDPAIKGGQTHVF